MELGYKLTFGKRMKEVYIVTTTGTSTSATTVGSFTFTPTTTYGLKLVYPNGTTYRSIVSSTLSAPLSTASGAKKFYVRQLYSNFRNIPFSVVTLGSTYTIEYIDPVIKSPSCISYVANNNTFLPTELPTIDEWVNLNRLTILGTNTLTSVPKYPNMQYLSMNSALSSIPDWDNLILLSLTNTTLDTLYDSPVMETINITGTNTVSEVKSWPNLKSFTITGNNTISEVVEWPNLTVFNLRGNNTISGMLPNYPLLAQIYLFGNNTITSFHPMPNVTFLTVQGNNQVVDLPEMPLATTIVCYGSNTISTVKSWSAVQTLRILGNNTINEVRAWPNLTTLEIYSNFTDIRFDWATVYPWVNCTYFRLRGEFSYTAPRAWGTLNYIRLYYSTESGGLKTDPNQVANMIIDVSNAIWTGSTRTFDIRGCIAPTTSSALTDAIARLVSKSVSVLY